MRNLSIDGKIYGIPRTRDYPRNAMIYRKDWAEQLGFSSINTLQQLYMFMKRAADSKIGGEGMYGFALAAGGGNIPFLGPIDQICVAYGAPNVWGYDNNKGIYPWFDTDEFMNGMDYARKLYSEGLINKDFAALPTTEWVNGFRTNKASVHMDVHDESTRSQNVLTESYGTTDNVGILRMPTAPGKARRVTPQNDGYAGLVAIAKSSARNAAARDKVLNFLDLINNVEAVDLLDHGVLGLTYDLNDAGEVVRRVLENSPLDGFNQILTNVLYNITPQAVTPLRKLGADINREQAAYAIVNPTRPLISATYTKDGTRLDTMIADARVKYIAGEIGRAGFKKVVDEWYAAGGKKVAEEFTREYRKLLNIR
jgi:putative aldouronate transport system substrate-binding protein